MKTREKALDNYRKIKRMLNECRSDCMDMDLVDPNAYTMLEELALLISLERAVKNECIFFHGYEMPDLAFLGV